jgi:hypothetical protein
MTHARQLIEAHPAKPVVAADVLGRCIDACHDCAQSCAACADACLGEQELPTLVRCIRLNLDCADVCAYDRQRAQPAEGVRAHPRQSRRPGVPEACRACGKECEAHAAHMEHCRVCAESCRSCEQACIEIQTALVA